MKLHPRNAGWIVAFSILLSSIAWSQEPRPRLGYAYPAGGQRGTTFRVTLGGKFIADIDRVYVSGTGVDVRVLNAIEPMKSDEASKIRKQLSAISRIAVEKRTPEQRLELARLERVMANYLGETARRRVQPALNEAVAIEVTIASDAVVGQREMRVQSRRGLSNPIRFFVGRLPEFYEKVPGLVPELQEYSTPLRFPPKVTTDITLPAVANGQIIPRQPDYVHWQASRFTPGDADRFRFPARKGQKLVIAVAARQLIPYLADAVPGWFQATLTLYDDDGNELAFDDDFRFLPDPVLFFEVPRDGRYVVEIRDAIYRGRPDFVYRVTIGELPFITDIFPLGGPSGEQTTVQLTGWNLPVGDITMDAGNRTAGISSLSVPQADAIPHAIPFAVGTLPECRERESNDSLDAAQAVTLPVIVNGRIGQPGDWDMFRIDGRAGQQLIIEVTARRLASPLDSVVELTDAKGNRLAFNDDHDDLADALNTHQADSLISFTLPSDGSYCVRLADAQHQGGPEYAYRLRISPPRPDFELRVVPSGINAVSWQLTPITVFALRRDGFNGDIALAFAHGTEGIVMDGGVIPGGQDQVTVTLALARWLPAKPMELHLEGRATIEGKEVVHEAVAADAMMQAFAYRHLVPSQHLTLLIPGKERRPPRPKDPSTFTSMWSVLSEVPVRIPLGGSAHVQARAPWDARRGEIQVELTESPGGVTVEKSSCEDRTVTITLHAAEKKAKSGLRGNLLATGFQKRTETNKQGKTREYRTFLGPLPAIPFEIVAP